MAKSKSLSLPPFPPLTWDGFYWHGRCVMPWYPTDTPIDLTIYTATSDTGKLPLTKAPQPTAEQAKAYEELLTPKSVSGATMIAALKESFPELDELDLASLSTKVELGQVILFSTVFEAVSYVGFTLGSLEYDGGHGFGLVIHRDRLGLIGFAEEACEEEAAKDLRRRKRKKPQK
ncbi:MAG: hypothetical protein ACRC8S_22875 [Fimbriiglobus sp.]